MTSDYEELRRAIPDALWTGRWYDAGCNTVHCDYNGKPPEEHGEVAHPEPLGITEYLAAANPATIARLLSELDATRAQRDEARKDAERYRWLRERNASVLKDEFGIFTAVRVTHDDGAFSHNDLIAGSDMDDEIDSAISREVGHG